MTPANRIKHERRVAYAKATGWVAVSGFYMVIAAKFITVASQIDSRADQYAVTGVSVAGIPQ